MTEVRRTVLQRCGIDMTGPRRWTRLIAATALTTGLALTTSPGAHSIPTPGPTPPPYPDTNLILRSYHLVRYEDYFTASAFGVWFSTPRGLNCGIYDRGDFGCAGDITGAPAGARTIGWHNGNIVTRYDPQIGAQFPPGRPERELPPRSYIEYNATRCVTMADASTYCTHGPFKFYITPGGTYLSPP